MGHKFSEIAFTDSVRRVQQDRGSRKQYQRFEQGEDHHHLLTDKEKSFIASRDSFYMASVNDDGWPYVQHRGGPAGFARVINDTVIGFADFRGNRQYVSVGNVQQNKRVSLFFMDYPNRRRLKLFGRASVTTDPDLCRQLTVPGYKANVEQAFLITVEGYDWNCPQHITPRYSEAELETLIAAEQKGIT